MVDQSPKRSILTCYKLSDYCVDQWLTDLWSCTSNAEFKTLLLNNKIIAGLISYCEEVTEFSIEDLK
jgi:hypothetical protein